MASRLLWTRAGVGHCIGGVLLLMFGAVAHSMAAVMVGGVLVMLLAVDAVVAARRLPSVRLKVLAARVPEGATVTVEVSVDGSSRRGQQVMVGLDEGLAVREGHSNILDIDGPAANIPLDLEARVRGPRRIGPVQVRSWTLARLWAWEDDVSQAWSVDVIPRQEDVRAFGLRSTVLRPMQGRFSINRPGQGFEFFALRQYQSGDTIRDVNWKASARRDELIVNQRLRETHTDFVILLDARMVSRAGPTGATPLDRGCRFVLGLYADAVRARDSVYIFAYGDGVVDAPLPRQDRVHAMEMFLSRLDSRGTARADEAWDHAKREVTSHGPVIIISSGEDDPTLPETLASIVARGHPVTLFSPTPTGRSWDRASAAPRQQARQRMLEMARNTGAVVVDWKPGMAAEAERPPIMRGMVH